MNIFDLDRFRTLSGYFTTDAWQLIESFLVSFQKKMSQLDINPDEQKKVTTGIMEYIEEFVENYKDISKITFNEAINLVRDIGSPSEILQAMDVSFDQIIQAEVIERPEIEKPLICNSCNWPNDSDARFCDNCGKNIHFPEPKIGKKFPLELIQYSYIAVFCLSYLGLIIIGILNIILQFSPLIKPNLTKIPDLFSKLYGIATDMVIPSIILGFVLGYIIKRYYHNSVIKNYRYNMQLAQYRKYFSLGLILSLIAIWLFFIYSPLDVTRNEFISMSILLFLLSLVSLIGLYRWNLSQAPANVSYFALIRFINSYENEKLKKLRNTNVIGGLIIFIGVYGLWGRLMFWTVYGFPAWFAVFLSLLLLFNGFYLLYYFSWAQTIKYLNL